MWRVWASEKDWGKQIECNTKTFTDWSATTKPHRFDLGFPFYADREVSASMDVCLSLAIRRNVRVCFHSTFSLSEAIKMTHLWHHLGMHWIKISILFHFLLPKSFPGKFNTRRETKIDGNYLLALYKLPKLL